MFDVGFNVQLVQGEGELEEGWIGFGWNGVMD